MAALVLVGFLTFKMNPLSLQASVNRKPAWPGNPHYTAGGSHVGPFSMSAAE